MKRTETVMGMPVTVELVTVAGGVDARAAVAAVFDWFRGVDRIFSTYKADSVISRVNSGELQLDEAPAEVREVLAAGGAMRGQTGGFFEMRHPDGQLDPSGYVKGWAIGRAGARLVASGFRDFCVEAGGDIMTHGHNADGEAWSVGVRNPFRTDEIVKVLRLGNGAVATSGNYERGEHIYDPRTGRGAREVASVTVVGPDIVWTDVAATAAFAMGVDGAAWLAEQPGLEGYVIGLDGRAALTPGLARYL